MCKTGLKIGRDIHTANHEPQKKYSQLVFHGDLQVGPLLLGVEEVIVHNKAPS